MSDSLATDAMSRLLAVDIRADTLQGALETIEHAYNERYSDMPLLSTPMYVKLLMKTRADAAGNTLPFELRTEASLREVVLTILDQTGDPAICYSLSESKDAKDRTYLSLRLLKRDALEMEAYEDVEEYNDHMRMLDESVARMDGYLEAAAQRESQARGADEDMESR